MLQQIKIIDTCVRWALEDSYYDISCFRKKCHHNKTHSVLEYNNLSHITCRTSYISETYKFTVLIIWPIWIFWKILAMPPPPGLGGDFLWKDYGWVICAHGRDTLFCESNKLLVYFFVNRPPTLKNPRNATAIHEHTKHCDLNSVCIIHIVAYCVLCYGPMG